MLKNEWEHLNEQQKEAVLERQAHLLVIAPAGTGKTKVIAMRTAYLIEEGAKPEEILCLTFTNKAAKEMKERILQYTPKAVKTLTVKTFHAFCYYLIMHEKASSHFSFPCTLIDETDTECILRDIVQKNKIDDDRVYYPSVLSFFENIKKFSLTLPQETRDHYQMVFEAYQKEVPEKEWASSKYTQQFIKRFGRQLFNTYRRYLQSNNALDFTDLVVEAYYLLEKEDIRTKWQHQYKWIQIDEMQDTSCIEYELIHRLAATSHLAFFGDFNQTIYEWRGSKPLKMVEQFKKDYEVKTIQLNQNYRSTQLLLEAANAYIASSRLYPMQCEPYAATKGEKITIIEAKNKTDECQRLCELIKASKREKQSQGLAVLTRTNHYAKEIADYFNAHELSATVIEDTKFFRQKTVKDLLAFFEYSLNERNSYALEKIVRHPYIHLEPWLLEALKETKNSYFYLKDWFKTEATDPYEQLWTSYKKSNIVVLDVEATGLCTTQDEIVQIAAIQYGEKGKCAQMDVLLKPTRSVGESFYVHGFSDQQLQEEGISPKEALEQLVSFAKGKVIVGHNINYDLQIIKSMLNRYHLQALQEVGVYDTLDLAQKVYPKLPNHKLDTLSKWLVTQTAPTHNAFQDILATADVLTHLLYKIEERKQERLEALEAYDSYVTEYRQKLNPIKNYLLTHSVGDSLTYLMNECGFKGFYSPKEMQTIRQLYKIAEALREKHKEASFMDQVIEFLAFSCLHYSEIEQSDLFKERIPVITIHQAKGLEFDTVYLAGCNEGVFPSQRSVKEGHLAEEMRLFYVGMTRAKKQLFISYQLQGKKSIFIDEIAQTYKKYGKSCP